MSHPDAPRNQFGIASLILGVVALITCWLLIGVPFGIAAVVTGDIGRRRVKRGEANNPRTAMAGMVLGLVAIVAGLVAVGYYSWLSAHQMEHYHQCLINGTYTHC
jgi:ABC-type phosphate transport system permease subunit